MRRWGRRTSIRSYITYRGRTNITTAPRERGVVGRGPMRNLGVNAEASGGSDVRGRAVHGTVLHRPGLQPRLQAGRLRAAPRERGVVGRWPMTNLGVNAEASGLRGLCYLAGGKREMTGERKLPDANSS